MGTLMLTEAASLQTTVARRLPGCFSAEEGRAAGMARFVEQIAICRAFDNLRWVKKSEQITARRHLFAEAVERAFVWTMRHLKLACRVAYIDCVLFDHLVGVDDKRLWNRETERLRSLEIQNQL